MDLVHFPAQARSLRLAPVPDGVLILLRIVAGDEEAINAATQWAGRSRDAVYEAAVFFIEQILLYPSADSYRVLGGTPEHTTSELRRNMALLLRWLHPDRDRQGERSILAARVTRAWGDLKTEDRRTAYDRSRCISLTKPLGQRRRRSHQRHLKRVVSPQLVRKYAWGRGGLLHRVLVFFLGGAEL
jgi:hypothetical protein